MRDSSVSDTLNVKINQSNSFIEEQLLYLSEHNINVEQVVQITAQHLVDIIKNAEFPITICYYDDINIFDLDHPYSW